MKLLNSLTESEVKKNKLDLIDLHEKKKRPLILDGAVGSLLQQNGVQTDSVLWSSLANLSNPEMVVQLHSDYIISGSEIITTNTFRTNPNAFEQSNLKMTNEEFVRKSVQLAIEARGNHQIIIAGSNGPAENCYQVERTISKNKLEKNHKLHIEYLWNSGCDIVWNETQSHADEIEIICKYCSNNSLPFAINLYFDEALNLLSGESLGQIVELIMSYSPSTIGFNCIKPELVYKYVESYQISYRFGLYFNCGTGKVTDLNLVCGIDPRDYLQVIKLLLEYDPLFVGSCCGSNPRHTKVIKEYFDEVYGC